MPTIYADVLFLLNLSVDFVLLYICGRFFGENVRFFRLLVASVLGGVLSFKLFLPVMPVYLSLGLNLSGAFVLCFCAFYKKRPRGLKILFKIFLGFIAVSAALAGIMLGVLLVLHPENAAYINGSFYIDISPAVLLGSAAVFFGICSFARRFWRRENRDRDTVKLTVCFMGETLRIPALTDTGNLLRDVFDDIPVIVISYDAIKGHIPEFAREFLSNTCVVPPEINNGCFRIIPYNAVGSTGILPAFIPESVYITDKNGSIFLAGRCAVAVSKNPVGNETSALVPPSLCEEMQPVCFSESVLSSGRTSRRAKRRKSRTG